MHMHYAGMHSFFSRQEPLISTCEHWEGQMKIYFEVYEMWNHRKMTAFKFVYAQYRRYSLAAFRLTLSLSLEYILFICRHDLVSIVSWMNPEQEWVWVSWYIEYGWLVYIYLHIDSLELGVDVTLYYKYMYFSMDMSIISRHVWIQLLTNGCRNALNIALHHVPLCFFAGFFSGTLVLDTWFSFISCVFS